jgi:hypothetical protein
MLEKAMMRDAQNRSFEVEVRKFGEILKDDAALLARLEATSDAHSFITTYVNMAAEKGIHFTADNMKVIVQEQKTGHNWIIPKSVLNMVRERF